ncbi:MAG: glutamyl-tRNA amidotransferase [Candidatus Yanofskybacteria bacterium CG10_big_fil_rev_8_21_14_0_10_36_16]|uniref:Glutamyl-tRNA amidotransferase n=1 Tax=Candidatus Yanofskybacteria bacterium CG10_big_fil_rev_8_21_14_0_10_36_16 TaxID=1975096 RepID=A0A2J0Q815_9BACT|nr:MAG: glutamyl-tRNA amidotransferase [Candidatus Yanofskybacteria bacterium CG10_big_fil_rev_8_21_14_0_10_36_16]
MALKEQIKKELNESLKTGDQAKRLVLSTLMSAVKNKEVEKRTKISKEVSDTTELEKQSQLTDEEMIQTIASEIKKRKESVELFKQGNREELAQKEQAEMEILQAYMPEQLSEDKVREEVKSAIDSVGASGPQDMGKVIGQVMGKFKGQVDGGLVSKIAKELLS